MSANTAVAVKSSKDALSPAMERRVSRSWPKLIAALREGETAKQAARRLRLSYRRIHEFRRQHPDKDAEFKAALLEGVEAMVDALLDIIDQEKDTSKARLKVETIKWLAAVRDPERFSDKSRLDIRVQKWDMTAALQSAEERLRRVIDVTPESQG